MDFFIRGVEEFRSPDVHWTSVVCTGCTRSAAGTPRSLLGCLWSSSSASVRSTRSIPLSLHENRKPYFVGSSVLIRE